ncbi:MAG: hypothetical protein P5702_21510, partial [Limnospira sp. PMC 1291.21]|uniref:hypothetical protein n=1 Tax=Limnospira sp. PMC 1291.21 TaxID=2981074 RepID=UPI0028E0F82C
MLNAVELSGNFAIRSRTDSVRLDAETSVSVQALTIGASNVSAFAGFDGIGLQLSQIQFGLGIFSEVGGSREWVALQAEIGSASLQGISEVTLSVSNFRLEINQAAADGRVIDFAAQPFSIATGISTALPLNFAASRGELLAFSGELELAVAEFVRIQGAFAFERSAASLQLDTGNSVQANTLRFGGSNVNAFVGINGGTPDAVGFQVTGLTFALLIATDAADSDRRWITLETIGGAASFAGLPGVTLTASDIAVLVNLASA